MLQQGCVRHPLGGFTKEGNNEKFALSLLDEAPTMPTASRMLEILAENPVAQARFFVLSMRLFLEHVLSSGSVAFSPLNLLQPRDYSASGRNKPCLQSNP